MPFDVRKVFDLPMSPLKNSSGLRPYSQVKALKFLYQLPEGQRPSSHQGASPETLATIGSL
jgi:hypothetical protein